MRKKVKFKSKQGALLFGVIALSGIVATVVFFLMQRQSESVKVIVSEVNEAQSHRLLSDAAIQLASNLRDNRDYYIGHYDCDASPQFKHLRDVGFPSEYQDVYFSCHLPATLGEFFLKVEKRKAQGAQSLKFGSGIGVQGSKCQRTIFSFETQGPGIVFFDYNPAMSDPSDHKWSGGSATLPACAVGRTCYQWSAPSTIVLKSLCAPAMTAANLANANIRKLTKTFKDMPGLLRITLSSNYLTTLDGNTFQGLSVLEGLSLYDNKLSGELPASLFSSLVAVETLDLRVNKLTSFHTDQFATNTKLENLYLGNNLVGPNFLGVEVSDTLFESLIDLKRLWLDSNKLQRILPNTFLANTKLVDLNLNSNELPNLESGAFNGLGELLYLGLYDNLLGPQLPADVFNPLVKLDGLDLRINKLKSFPSNQFSQNTKLKNLYMGNNLIGPNLTGVELPNTLFAPLVELQRLRLDSNKLQRILPNTFLTNTKLRDFNLNSNELSNLESGAFNGLGELLYLGLFDNLLGPQLPADVLNPLVKLDTLDFRINKLKSFPANQFSQNTKLQNLYLSINEIGPNSTGLDFPSTLLDPLVDLTRLWLADNDLQRILPNTFSKNAKLFDLNLYSNSLPNLEAGVFNGLTSLQNVGLFNNLLTLNLPANIFDSLPSVRVIDLRNNQLNATYFNQLMQELLTKNTLTHFYFSGQIPKANVDPARVTALKNKGVYFLYDP